MGLKNLLLTVMGRKSTSIGRSLSLFNLGQPIWTPRDYASFADEGYQKNVIAYAAIREVARGAASVPWLLYDGKGKEVERHPLLTLMKRPNPLQGGASFIEAVLSFYLISGNTYIEAVGPAGRPPRELYTHRPDRMQVIPGNKGFPAAYEYTVNGARTRWDVDFINMKAPLTQIKSFNPLNDWYGMSPLEAAAFSVDIHNKANAWNKSLLDNGARPSGALVYAAPVGQPYRELNPMEYDRLKQQINENIAGAANAGKPLLLEGGLGWQEMGLSPKDMEFLESKNTSARDVALAYGVPPMVLGIPGDNTYSNYQEARLALWEGTILPLLDMFTDHMNNWLVPSFGEGLMLGYDDDHVSALAPRREAVWTRVKDADFLTDNEKREAVGYEPIQGGDELYKPLTSMPIGTPRILPTSSNDDASTEEGADNDPAALEAGKKFLNLGSQNERYAEWLVQVRLMARYEKSFAAHLEALFKSQAAWAANAYTSSKEDGVNIVLGHPDFITPLDTLLRAQYNVVMPGFGGRILNAFKSNPGGWELKDRDVYFESLVQGWINKYAADKVTLITMETRERIRKAIANGQAAQESLVQIAQRIEESVGKDIAFSRARTIATTETHAAATAANDLAAESTGLNLKRRWLTAHDKAVRPSHAAANMQTRDAITPFDIGGHKLLRPGDPQGPAAEVINCRCVIDYVTGGTL